MTIIVALILGAVTLGLLSAREMQRMIRADFNAQQLALAQHAAHIIEQHFKTLKSELLTLSLSPSIQYVEPASWGNRMKISLSSVREYGVFRIKLIDPSATRSHTINYNQALYEETQLAEGKTEYFQWGRKPQSKNKVFITDLRKDIVENSETGLVIDLVTPVYQISPNQAHPVPTQNFSGLLVFSLDVGYLARKIGRPIRSGKSGYAWIIDDSGRFLYHLEEKFVGQNAFEARALKDPHISFTKINSIQKENMLQGQEGTAWYVSGWHRGDTGKQRKLIAFAPVKLTGSNSAHTWSVAVVAPISEVQDAIQRVYIRQAMIQVAFTLAFLIVLFSTRANEMRWVRTLELEVRKKTKDLQLQGWRLKQSEERYRSLVESADDLICAIDAQCRVLAINQRWTRLTGQAVDQATGSPIGEIIEFGDWEGFRSLVDRVREHGRPVSREEVVRIGGRQYWLHIKVNIVSAGSEQGALESPNILIIARDVTDQKRVEKQLANSQKLAALGELSAGVAHEINNPIAIILGFSEILLENEPQGSRRHEILKAIERQGENCKRIVENLLAFARIPKREGSETDLAEAVGKIVDVVKNTLLTKKVELKTDLPAGLPKVCGHGAELEQVFLNIINNAIAAMEDGGNLTISATRQDDMVAVDFRDTGKGIVPEHLEKIFEPFFTTKNVGEGTGLGLSVSYGIIQNLGGDILVESRTASETQNHGSVFTVLLPACKPETASQSAG